MENEASLYLQLHTSGTSLVCLAKKKSKKVETKSAD
jgi:hypothetical protein